MDVTIPDLPPGAAPMSTSPFESVEAGTSVRYTLAQITAAITGGGGTGPFLPITGGTLTGPLGVGAAPSLAQNILEVRWDWNDFARIIVKNADPGANAAAQVLLSNNTTFGGLQINGTGTAQPGLLTLFNQSAAIDFHVNGAERMRIDASGNVGIGTSTILNIGTGHTIVDIKGTDAGRTGVTLLRSLDDSMKASFYGSGGNIWLGAMTSNPLLFTTNNNERARITAEGYFKASNSGGYHGGTTAPYHELYTNAASIILMAANASASSPYGIGINFDNAALNNQATYFLSCGDSATTRAIIYNNGGLANYSANNVNLSDATVKADITPYDDKDLDALEHSFRAVNWCKFKYRDQSHDDWNHGYIAQDIARAFASSAPELIDETTVGVPSPAAEGTTRKAVYDTDLTHIGLALLARSLKKIADLEARLAKAGV